MGQELISKYYWLATTIFNSRRITLKSINDKWLRSELSNKSPITRRTFHNHKLAIQNLFRISIKCDSINNEYYIEDADEINTNTLSLWLLNSFSISNLIRESSDIKDRIVLENIPSGQRYLTEIVKAMRDNLVLRINYQAFWSELPQDITLHPYFVKLFNRRWYVYGRTASDEKVKVYALDRLKELTVTDEKFKIPADFSAEIHLYNSIGILKNDTDKPCEIIVKAYGDTAKYLRELPLHHSQKELETKNSSTTFSYWLAPTDDFYQEILSKREYLQVVSPHSVRVKLADIVMKLSQFYSLNQD